MKAIGLSEKQLKKLIELRIEQQISTQNLALRFGTSQDTILNLLKKHKKISGRLPDRYADF